MNVSDDEINEMKMRAYREGVADAKAKREEWTHRLYAVLAALVVIFAGATIAWSVNQGAQREQTLRLACVDEGGIFLNGTCTFSSNGGGHG